MRKGTVIFAVLVLLLAACRKEGAQTVTPTGPEPDLSSALAFDPGVKTKGLDPLTNLSLQTAHFGLFASWNHEGIHYDNDHETPEFYLVNREVYLDSDTWRCNPTAYWPFDAWLNFFPYAPYQEHTQPYEDGDGNTVQPVVLFPSEDYVEGLPRVRFTPNSDVSHQLDLCIGTPTFDRDKTGGAVPVTFEHALTRLRFYINVSGSDPGIFQYRVTDLIVKGIADSNIFTYTDGGPHPFEWDSTDEAGYDGSFHLTAGSGQLVNGVENPVKFTGDLSATEWPDRTDLSLSDWITYCYTFVNEWDNGRLYMVPQTLKSSAKVEIALSIFRANGSLVSILPPIEKALPSSPSWEPGTTISYLISISIYDSIQTNITALQEGWDDAGNTHPSQNLE